MTYIKQLDSLRAIAVLLVIITHWFPEKHFLNLYTSVFNGVDIFFVLSGFLITRILLEDREETELQNLSKFSVVKCFFAKRFIRIFPVYYFVLVVLYIIGDRTETNVKAEVLYYLTYTANIHFFLRQEWDGMLSHLWSLSVEEQFYLIWPWLMLFLPRKYLPYFICLFIAIGVIAQVLLINVTFGDILTFSCFDGFGLGALLAWLFKFRISLLKRVYPYLSFIAICCFALQVARVANLNSYFAPPSRTLTSLCTIWIITFIILYSGNKSSISAFILNNRILIFIGKISYGVYLYHLPVRYLEVDTIQKLNDSIPFNFGRSLYFLNLEYFIILLIISYASWKIIEQPLLFYKKHFNLKSMSLAAKFG